MISPRFAIAAAAVAAVAATALTIDLEQAARQRAQEIALAQDSVLKGRKALMADANFPGTPVCFQADGKETRIDAQSCELMVWYGDKKAKTDNQLSVLPLTGPHAGIGVIFQPAADGGTLRIRHLAQEQKIKAAGDIFSAPLPVDQPVEYLYQLRQFRDLDPPSFNLKTKMVFTKTVNNQNVFKVSGDILKGRGFEIQFGRQHKLAVNLNTGSFVFNTYGASTFYGKYKVMTAANAPIVEASALRP